MEARDLEVLHDALGYRTGNERETRSKQYLELRRLIDLGIFASGPFQETYTTGRESLGHTIRHYSTHTITRKFCLEVTQNCNFRCTYCPYTAPSSNRPHSLTSMTPEVARKAIDRYFERYCNLLSGLSEGERRRVVDEAPPNLGWYGGEPLLNFEVIRASHAHFSTLPWHSLDIEPGAIHYTINTNFSVVNDEMLAFLVENAVLCYISIDGPATENDRHRVDRHGRGTFLRVQTNLGRLQAYDEEYFRTRVILLSTWCQDHDRARCREFLQGLGPLNFQSDAQLPGRVVADLSGSAAPDDEVISVLVDSVLKGGETLGKHYEQSLTVRNVIKSLNREFFSIRTSVPSREDVLFPLGMRTCPMGFDQLFVSADGLFHMCQKTDNSLPLGNCEKGYHDSAIVEGYFSFHAALNSNRCRSCWAIRFCTVCSAPLLQRGIFNLPGVEECDHIRSSVSSSFRYFQVLSENEELVEWLAERGKSGIVEIPERMSE
jgi:uncharacterized protein